MVCQAMYTLFLIGDHLFGWWTDVTHLKNIYVLLPLYETVNSAKLT